MLWILRLSLSRDGKALNLQEFSFVPPLVIRVFQISGLEEKTEKISTQLELSCLPFPLGFIALTSLASYIWALCPCISSPVAQALEICLLLQQKCLHACALLPLLRLPATCCWPVSCHVPSTGGEGKGGPDLSSEWPPPGWLGGGGRNVAVVLCISHNHGKKITHTLYSFARNC